MTLFCLSRTVYGDCTRLLFGLANRLFEQGEAVRVASWGRRPDWIECRAPFSQVADFGELIDICRPELTVASNVQLLPMLGPGRVALLCQGYESYYFGSSLEELRQDHPLLVRLQRLPVGLMACSRSVQGLLRRHVDREAWLVPVAFERRSLPTPTGGLGEGVARILVAGAPGAAYKCLGDAISALRLLMQHRPVQMVLISPETRPSKLPDFSLPTEVHYRPDLPLADRVRASCHAYCCSSWYEGYDLNTLESLEAGLVVVSTRNLGVDDYGVDEHNMLLVEPGRPQEMAAALERVLGDEDLRKRLVREGRARVSGHFDWSVTVSEFQACRETLRAEPPPTPQARLERQEALKALEREGFYTPLATVRALEECQRVLEGNPGPEELGHWRQFLKPLLANPRHQSYALARSLYDRAQRLLLWPPCSA